MDIQKYLDDTNHVLGSDSSYGSKVADFASKYKYITISEVLSHEAQASDKPVYDSVPSDMDIVYCLIAVEILPVSTLIKLGLWCADRCMENVDVDSVKAVYETSKRYLNGYASIHEQGEAMAAASDDKARSSIGTDKGESERVVMLLVGHGNRPLRRSILNTCLKYASIDRNGLYDKIREFYKEATDEQ